MRCPSSLLLCVTCNRHRDQPKNFHGFLRSLIVAPSQLLSQCSQVTTENQQKLNRISKPEPRSKLLLPEETLPRGEVGALEECVLQDPFHPAQGLDHVRAVIVQVPEFAIVPLVRPPERVLLQHLQTKQITDHSPGCTDCGDQHQDDGQ